MSKNDPMSGDVNSKIKFPKINTGLSKSQAGGTVNTNWKNIDWTRKKLFFTSIALGIPYVVAIIASFVTGIYLITTILISLGILVVLAVEFLKSVDRNDEF